IFEPTSRILAETVVFSTIAISEFGRALVSRSENLNIWKLRPNKWLVPALLTSLVLQLIVVYTPLNKFFDTVPLTLEAWMYIAIVPLVIFITDEVRKLLGIKLSPT
ncbi:MAG: cation-translocating P-type ATPase C-terminal domain-containing protein, partial [Desulfurococcus sp.]